MGFKKCPQVLIPTGLGVNCEAETAHAFRLAGAAVTLIHLHDLIQKPTVLTQTTVLVFAGGFSFGDHLGSGRVLANRLRQRLGPALQSYIEDGGLVLGICNGFQTMVRLGWVPGDSVRHQTVTLAANRHGTFYDGWVTLAIDPQSPCVFTRGMSQLEVPVRHGEGRLLCSEAVIQQIQQNHLAPVRYIDPHTHLPTPTFPHNPNDSLDAIAGLCDTTGRLFGLMPHPEAFLYLENHPHWRRRSPHDKQFGDGLQIFRNAIEYSG